MEDESMVAAFYVNDLMHGMAKYKYNSGDEFKGNYVNGKKEGKWIHTYADNQDPKEVYYENDLEKES